MTWLVSRTPRRAGLCAITGLGQGLRQRLGEASLPTLGIAGGSVYDALVGAAAVESGLVLFSRDARAIRVYRALQVDVEVIRDEH
jgi:predicted nucleic acid-binding protein